MTDQSDNFSRNGKGLPKSDEQSAMADWIYAAPDRHSVKYTLNAKGKKPPIDIHFVVRHADVMSILKGGYIDQASAGHYDDLLKSATTGLDLHPLEFLLGAPTSVKDERWPILHKAMEQSPRMDRRSADVFDTMAKRAVQKAVKTVKADFAKKSQFNVVRDYGFNAAFLAGAELTGMVMPNKPSIALRIVTFLQNRVKKSKIRLTPDLTPYNEALLWSQAIFGHVFSNIGDRSAVLRGAARHFSKAFLKQVRVSMSDAHIPPPGSMIERLRVARHEFPHMSDEEYDYNVAGIVYEFVGTLVILAGTSFSNILATLYENDLTPEDLLARLSDQDQTAIDEAMRLRPTTSALYRKVVSDFKLGDTEFKSGDMICMMLSRTMREPAIFPQPDILSIGQAGAPERKREDYLNFGPNEVTPNAFRPAGNAHVCFGQYWARNLIKQMFQGLTEFKDLTPLGPLTTLATLPDVLAVSFTPDAPGPTKERSQNLYTICSEIRCDDGNRPDLEAILIKDLESLENPAGTAMRERLLATKRIHFMSLSVIAGANLKEPSYLMMEMSADGDEDEVIEAIGKHASDLLGPIYKKAGCIKKSADLASHMKAQAVELTQSVWPEFFSGKRRNGLGFNGTGGLTVDRIHAEETIARFARDQITNVDETGAGTSDKTPDFILSTVRDALSAPDLSVSHPDVAEAKWALENSAPPIYAERADSIWNLGGGLMSNVVKMFPRPLLAYFGLFYLAITALISVFLFGQNTGRDKLCADMLGCTQSKILENPMNFAAIPEGTGPYFIFNNPVNIVFAVLLAFVFSIGVTIVVASFKRLSGGFLRHGFSRIGAIFWFILGLVLIAFLQSISPFLPEAMRLDLFEKPGISLFYMPLSYWVGIATATILVIFNLVISGRLNMGRLLSVLSATFLMIASLVIIVRHQINLHLIENDGSGDFIVLNRFAEAGLDQKIFYPLGMTILVTLAIYAFNLSFPKLNGFRKAKHYLAIFAVAFIFNFITTFFAWSDLNTLWSNLPDILEHWVFLPLLVGFGLMCFYLFFNRYLIGKRYNYKAFFKQLIGLSAIISALIHLPDLATQSLGEDLLSFLLAIPVTLILTAAGLAVLYLMIRRSEIANTPHDTEMQTSVVSDMMSNENQEAAQNHMTSVVRLIPDQFRRRFTLPLALSIILQGLSNNKYRPGFLGSIGTVHYARWIHLPKTNNYVFYSNYDGSFENYLEDFITKASFGLTGVWSHSVGFPKTELLFLKGSEDGDRFKRYARGSMIPTPFWFSAYPSVSAEQIRRNALIRDGIARIDNPSDAEAWLDLFGSVTRPAHVIQNSRVQSLMFSGGGYLRSGACLVVRSKTKSSDDFRQWVNAVSPHITYGEGSPRTPSTYIAFGSDGLELLGLSEDLKQTEPWDGRNELTGPPHRVKFPPAFSMGMDHPTRQNILGDAGPDAPENWKWGSGEKKNHAVLFAYAPDPKQKKSLIKIHKDLLKQYGLDCEIIRFEDLPEKGFGKEPFGFVDGISQPILRGTKRGSRTGDSVHLVNPGEFILGYEDDRGYYPPSPQIHAHRDRDRDLPATVTELPQRYPKFETEGEHTLRDLGRNGSYLVIRQLEQDHEGFQKITGDIGKKLCPHDPDGARDVIQAKMMGRWQDGRSMAQNPVRIHRNAEGRLDFDYKRDLKPVNRPFNEFLFGQEDPQGHDCPFGSHIRRSNPRDGLEPDSANALSITNRHRILRRGRAYIDGNKKGTFFVCLNADLDRQFEFIQQTWVGSAKFHGLRDEVDPITAQGLHRDLGRSKDSALSKDNLRFTIQTPGQEIPITGLRSFVTMRGGGYFFLPSKDALRFLGRPK